MTGPEETLGSSTRGSGVVALAWVAIGFGVISLPGLLVFLPFEYDTPIYDYAVLASNVAPFTATLSWLLAVIATAISGIRLIRPPRTRNAKRAFAMAAPGAVLGTAALVAVVILIGNMLGLFQSNLAAMPAEAVIDHYLGNGASVICYTENNGHFINSTPWYSALVDAPASMGTEAEARQALELAGYPDAQRTEVPDQYGVPESSEAFVVESLTVNPSEYEGDEPSPQARVTVYADGPASADCTPPGGEYGDDVTPSAGRVLIHVHISLEPTR